jgi:hypothetical protein
MTTNRFKVSLTWTRSIEVELPAGAEKEDFIDFARIETSKQYDGSIQYLLADSNATITPVTED